MWLEVACRGLLSRSLSQQPPRHNNRLHLSSFSIKALVEALTTTDSLNLHWITMQSRHAIY
jgi:hypothetical protein